MLYICLQTFAKKTKTKEFGDESATSSNNPDPPRSTNSTGSELNAKQRKPTNWKENQLEGKPLWNHNHENTKVNLILICTFKNSYSSSFFPISKSVTVGPGISISNHCSGRWEWWKARGAATLWSVFSQDPTTTEKRPQPMEGTWPQPDRPVHLRSPDHGSWNVKRNC